MSKGRATPPKKIFSNGGTTIKEKAKGTVLFLEGIQILQRYLTEMDDDVAEEKLAELRAYRQSIHALAAEKKLRG